MHTGARISTQGPTLKPRSTHNLLTDEQRRVGVHNNTCMSKSFPHANIERQFANIVTGDETWDTISSQLVQEEKCMAITKNVLNMPNSANPDETLCASSLLS